MKLPESLDLYVEGRLFPADAQRQTRSARAILDRFALQPGVVLGDEVGMGKTFVALAVAAERLGMLDRYIIIRDSVNMDVFMNGASPASLWDPDFKQSLASESSVEAADIFATAMENNFKVGRVVVDAILNGSL